MTLAAPSTSVPRRAAETSRRLLAAAREVLIESGIANATISDITARAGYTRGAFYSAFGTLDELHFALYQKLSADILHSFEERLDMVPEVETEPVSMAQTAAFLLDAVRIDRDWAILKAGFIELALRRADVHEVLVAHLTRMRESLASRLLVLVSRLGRRPRVDPIVLSRMVEAAYDGATAQALIDDEGRRIRLLLLEAVLRDTTIED